MAIEKKKQTLSQLTKQYKLNQPLGHHGPVRGDS